MLITPEAGHLPELADLIPVLDDDVILEGSMASYGYRVPATGEVGEVFMQGAPYTPISLEIWPLDGQNKPVEIQLGTYSISDNEVVQAIMLALISRPQDPDNDFCPPGSWD